MMKFGYGRLLSVVFVGVVVSGASVLSGCKYSAGQIESGNEIVARIDDFVAKNDTLPLSLNEIGIKDTGYEVHYDGYVYWYIQNGCGDYYLQFRERDGETDMVYFSAEKTWSEGHTITLCD